MICPWFLIFSGRSNNMPLWLMILLLAIVLLLFSRPFKIKHYREQQSKDAILSPEEMEKHVREIAKLHTFTKTQGHLIA